MDLRAAWRGMTRGPGFAALVVATMALGIGANTTMFGVIRAVFLRPLPFPAPGSVGKVGKATPSAESSRSVRAPNSSLETKSTCSTRGTLPNWTGTITMFTLAAGCDERVTGLYASWGSFGAWLQTLLDKRGARG